jgi:hypothetical protein
MAEQKYNLASEAGQAERHSISGPLFEDPLDFDTQGGLVVLDTGQVAEVTPPLFVLEGGDMSLSGMRVQSLPFDVVDTGEGRIISWREVPYNTATPTIGLETEHTTMADYEGEWHQISPDGRFIYYPSDREREPADRRGHQPEYLKNTTENGSPVQNLSKGYEDFAEKAAVEKEAKRRWGIHNGMLFVPISGYLERVTDDDITEHPYIDMLKRPEVMPRYLEYAPCVSEQLNIQWESPEAGAFAINGYQMLQSVLNLVTAAAPGRDGSFNTTLRDHYQDNPEFAAAKYPRSYQELEELVEKELGPFKDQVPDDWRELERAYGSPSGGVIQEAAPTNLESFLRRADGQLRRSETMTTGRTLGWHTDRWRPDKGVVEICNLSHAGDHPDKLPAAEEMVIRTIQALQEYFDDPDARKTYSETWDGIIPRPDERDDIYSLQRFVEVSRTNNLLVAVFGKERNVFDADWQERSPRQIFDVFADFVSHYAPEPLSTRAVTEIQATLESVPASVTAKFSKPNHVLDYFYSTCSKMTATEAFRMAMALDDKNPEISPRHLLQRVAHIANRKHRERFAAASEQ